MRDNEHTVSLQDVYFPGGRFSVKWLPALIPSLTGTSAERTRQQLRLDGRTDGWTDGRVSQSDWPVFTFLPVPVLWLAVCEAGWQHVPEDM